MGPLFGRMLGQKGAMSLTIRQKYTVCYSKTSPPFVRHEPDSRTHMAPADTRAPLGITMRFKRRNAL